MPKHRSRRAKSKAQKSKDGREKSNEIFKQHKPKKAESQEHTHINEKADLPAATKDKQAISCNRKAKPEDNILKKDLPRAVSTDFAQRTKKAVKHPCGSAQGNRQQKAYRLLGNIDLTHIIGTPATSCALRPVRHST